MIVASLYHMLVDPLEQGVTHRSRDYWDRSLFDHIRKLPEALAPAASPTSCSWRSSANNGSRSCSTSRASRRARRRLRLLRVHRAVRQQREQTLRVEALTDAYHLTFARGHGREAAYPWASDAVLEATVADDPSSRVAFAEKLLATGRRRGVARRLGWSPPRGSRPLRGQSGRK